MNKIRFIMPCWAEYEAEIEIPEDIVARDNPEEIAKFINANPCSIKRVGELEWADDACSDSNLVTAEYLLWRGYYPKYN